jgi:DNA-binding beta-propeller fold protein YncE
MHSRRKFMVASMAGLAACRRKPSGYPGYAFVANQEGGAVAVVDLESFALARHIRLDANPSQVTGSPGSERVYALTPENGTIHEIRTDTLTFARKLQVAPSAVAMRLAPDAKSLAVACAGDQRSVTLVTAAGMKVVSQTPLPADPTDLELSPDGRYAVVSYGGEKAISIVDLHDRRTPGVIRCGGEVGKVCFRGDSKCAIAADVTRHMLSIYDVASRQQVVDLPLACRPDRWCFNDDGGQLFVTGEGGDGVVIVYPYHTPEVGETVLVGHSPGAMAASASPAYLFVASPKSGDVSVLDIDSRKLIAVAVVGVNPNYIAITPDSKYALVLNETSGDMAVIRTGSIAQAASERWRSRRGALFMMVPLGSKPVSAAVMPV